MCCVSICLFNCDPAETALALESKTEYGQKGHKVVGFGLVKMHSTTLTIYKNTALPGQRIEVDLGKCTASLPCNLKTTERGAVHQKTHKTIAHLEINKH